MKKFYFSLVLSIAGLMMSAQDMIAKKDGTIIKAKIVEVGEDNIKYKKADNPDGPTYTVSKTSIMSVNYANGEVEKFAEPEKAQKSGQKSEDDAEMNEDGEVKAKGNDLSTDANMKRTIEGIAKDVGEQLLRNCASGKVDNSTTEVYWDQTFKNAISNEITLTMRVSWKPKWTDGSGKWIKGKVIIAPDGAKKWVYQNDNGLMMSGCAKTFKIK
jgi:hypothetical protein